MLMKKISFSILFVLIALISNGQTFSLVYPTAQGITLIPSAPLEVRWNSTIQGGTVKVEFSSNNGLTYSRTLATGIPNSAKRALVIVPNTPTNLGRIRIRLTPTGTSDTGRIDISANPIVVTSLAVCQPSSMVPTTTHITNVQFRNTATSPILRENPSTFISGTGTGFVNYAGTVSPVAFRQGSTFNLRVTVACPSAVGRTVGIWIDFNNDNTFQSTEMVASFPVSTSLTAFSGNIVVPTTASLGLKRIRVRLVGGGISSPLSSSAACATTFSNGSLTSTNLGETEDYLIEVTRSTTASLIGSGTGFSEEKYQIVTTTLTVFPNPAESGIGFFLNLTNAHMGEEGPTRVAVYNQLGSLVWEANPNQESETQFHLNLPKGLYFARYGSGQQQLVERILVK